MGCGGSKGPPLQTEGNTLKVLCLGVGGCGKTTFVKQMKIIHSIPWNDVEIENYVRIIRGNYVHGLQDCLEIAARLGLKPSSDNTAVADKIHSLRARAVDITADIQVAVTQLFPDPAIQEVIKNHSEQLTIKHLPYFLEHMDRVIKSDYIPNDEDILRCRQRTAGASSATIYIDKNYFEFFDIGGQKPERAKWEQVLADNRFAAILYFVAADEFDVGDEEKEFDRTKLEISRFIFSEIVNSNIIQEDVPVILFLNRRDLFEDRMKERSGWESFKRQFNDYDGGEDPKAGLDFMRNIFLDTVRPRDVNPIKHHYTCALDRESMIVVWRTVREYLLKLALRDIFGD